MRESFVRELTRFAEKDPRVIVISGDLGFGVLTAFAERFPRQFINAGVSEQNMTAIACGLALEGRKCFTYSIANFPTLRCLEQIRNDICYHQADVTVVSIGGGFTYGQLGMSHFATEDLAIMRALPHMKVVAPGGAWEAAEATKAILKTGGPAYLRLDRGGGGGDPRPGEAFKLGTAREVCAGRNVTLISTGSVLTEAVEASRRLADQGITTRVIAMHTVKPLDHAAVAAAARETGGIITIEEHTVVGGLGAAIAESCLMQGVAPAFFLRLGLEDEFPTVVGDQAYLRQAYGMNASAIETKVLHALGRARAG